MRKIVLIAAIAALSACQQKAAEPANDVNVAAANEAAPAVVPAAMSLNETTWTFTQDGKNIQESIDASGNYISTVGAAHDDHGTMVMKDGKACFTSAMNKEGEVCWTDPMVAVGGSGQTTSDKGETLTVKRTAYVPLTM